MAHGGAIRHLGLPVRLMASIPDIFADVKKRVQGYINPWTDEYEGETPTSAYSLQGGEPRIDEKKAEKVAHYAEGLFTDAKAYFEAEFERTKIFRYNTGKAGTFWDQNLMLESGDHWGVFGRRNKNEADNWKQELIDPVTGYNLRARLAYLTANWHDVQVSPNIQDIDAILFQDRKATRWGERIRDIVKYMGIFGEAWSISYLDKSAPYEGVATEFLCRPGSILLSPFAKGKERDEKCWYAVHADMVTAQWIAEEFPKFDISKSSAADTNILAYATSEKNQKQSVSYSHTKLSDMVEVWMDDPYIEVVPFEQEEFDARVGKLAETLQGVKQEPVEGMEEERVTPQYSDNHKKWEKAYYDFLEERAKFANKLSLQGKTTEEDEGLLGELTKLIYEQIDAHREMAVKTPFEGYKRVRYPYGRHIIKIGGRVAVDQPFEYEADWRKFIHKVYNEKVPLRLDGRSDVEIQRPTQLAIDTFFSRFGDHMLLNGLKKPWFPISMKGEIVKEGINQDPTKPGFSLDGKPPEYGQTNEPTGYITLIQLMKGISEKNVGISEVSFGKSAPQESGEKVNALLQQTEMVITGESSANLQSYVEEVVEARLLIMRQFYVAPRPYTIGGKQVLVSVAEMLKNVPVENRMTGEMELFAYPNFEITVRPDSNAPYRWERELNQLTQILGTMPPEMQPGFIEMILDLLSQRYPELGPNGKFRQTNKATQLGTEILTRREELTNNRKSMMESVAKKKSSQAVNEYLKRTGGNGAGKKVEA